MRLWYSAHLKLQTRFAIIKMPVKQVIHSYLSSFLYPASTGSCFVSIVGMICQKICGINSWMSWIVVCTITVIVSGCTIAILVFLFDRSIYEYVYSMFIKRSKDK